MATDHNPSNRRPHYHRGRRGMDRRGNDRRSSPQASPQSERSSNEVDVEQIMREIRSRISQRHGIELTPQQIQDLAARRLEAILDPRNVNPTLFEQLRKGAAAVPDATADTPGSEVAITDDAIYEGSGLVRFFRRLFRPLLNLLFNPSPLVTALQTQARINREIAAKAIERERRQIEWNALHYQVLQRLVTEVSRNSIEVQALTSRVEALGARVDFNDRRIRTLESLPAQGRSARAQEISQTQPPAPEIAAAADAGTAAATGTGPGAPSEGSRRRRRRRRGRRGTASMTDSSAAMGAAATLTAFDDSAEEDDGSDVETPDLMERGEPATSTDLHPSAGDLLQAEPSPESDALSPVREPLPPAVSEPSASSMPEPSVAAVPEPSVSAAPEPAPPEPDAMPVLPDRSSDTGSVDS